MAKSKAISVVPSDSSAVAMPMPSKESNKRLADFSKAKRLSELKDRGKKTPVEREKTAAAVGGSNAPEMPKLPRRSKKGQPCHCGCGETTRGGRFVPGHDARLYGWVKRVMSGKNKLEDIPLQSRKIVEQHIKSGSTKH